MKVFVSLMFLSVVAQAQISSGYLSAEQQKYYKNDSFDGNNQRERIDSAVVELNKIHGELAAMRAEIQTLKKEIEELRQKK